MDKMLQKKTKCKTCGNLIRIARHPKSKKFIPPKDCATCRTLGKEEAIRQRLISKSSGRTIINKCKEVKDGK